MKRLCSSLLLAMTVAAACTSADDPREGDVDATESRPNVLVIVTDDQRFTGTMSVMPTTKKLFAREGTSFVDAYTTTPLCCPARASIFTGRYAHNHNVRRGNTPLNLDQDTTMQRYLREGGYRTGMFGKYLNFWPIERDPPHFDEWAIFANSSESGYYGAGPWNVDGRVRDVGGYGERFLVRRAARFLRRAGRNDDSPWLAFVNFAAPHNPRTPERRYARAEVPGWTPNPAVTEADLTDKPNFQTNFDVGKRGIAPLEEARADYLRSLMTTDDLIGRIFGLLERTGQADDTLAFFVSDNGFHLGENGRFGKTVPYRMSIGVPFYIRWPGRFEGGAKDDRLVALIDIAPTIADASGVAIPGMDGMSLLQAREREELLIENWQAKKAWTAVVGSDPRFHYIEYYEDDGSTLAAQEYYDLRADPWELTNLFGDADTSNDPPASSIETLRERLNGYRTCRAGACP